MKHTTRIAITLPDELIEKSKQRAWQMGLHFNNFIIVALAREVDKMHLINAGYHKEDQTTRREETEILTKETGIHHYEPIDPEEMELPWES